MSYVLIYIRVFFIFVAVFVAVNFTFLCFLKPAYNNNNFSFGNVHFEMFGKLAKSSRHCSVM